MALAIAGAVIDWKRTLGTMLAAAVIAVALATLLYLPAFCYYAVTTRSLGESLARTRELWKHVASEVFSQIN